MPARSVSTSDSGPTAWMPGPCATIQPASAVASRASTRHNVEPSGRVVIASDNDIEGRTVVTVLRHMNLRCQVFSTATEALDALESGDALVVSAGLPDFPAELPDRTLVLGSGYTGPAANLRKPWTITALRAAVRRVMQSG